LSDWQYLIVRSLCCFYAIRLKTHQESLMWIMSVMLRYLWCCLAWMSSGWFSICLASNYFHSWIEASLWKSDVFAESQMSFSLVKCLWHRWGEKNVILHRFLFCMFLFIILWLNILLGSVKFVSCPYFLFKPIQEDIQMECSLLLLHYTYKFLW